MPGIDSEPLAKQGIAKGVGFRTKATGMNVVQIVEITVDADRFEHSARVGCIAVGEDEASARESRQKLSKALVSSDPVERNVVHVGKEVMRVDVMLLHQTGKRCSMSVEMRL